MMKGLLVGDYSAQAVVNTILSRAFPDDPIVGEEDASDLKSGTSETALTLRKRITELANEALTADLAYGDVADWGLGPGQERTTEELLNAIDRGNHGGGATGRTSHLLLNPLRTVIRKFELGMWTLDPIDGTKGFLRGEQYAVCLALIVDSRVELGVMGCPNLPHDLTKPDGPRGAIFVAVRGQGAEQVRTFAPSHDSSYSSRNLQRSLSLGDPKPLQIPRLPISDLSFLESVEAAHSSHSFNDRVSSTLGITKPPTRMDSQAKYCALARGDGGAYLRMPTGVGYKEKIWVHLYHIC